MAKRHSKTRTTFLATLVLALICALPWLLPGCSCRFDSRPFVIEQRTKVWTGAERDDQDSGAGVITDEPFVPRKL